MNSKRSYTKFLLATGKLQRIRAFLNFKDENSCVELAYADKLAEDSNGVKRLLVRQDEFDRKVYAKRMETKDSKEAACAFATMITQKIRPKKWVHKGTEFLESLKIFAKLKKYKFTLQ